MQTTDEQTHDKRSLVLTARHTAQARVGALMLPSPCLDGSIRLGGFSAFFLFQDVYHVSDEPVIS